MVITSERTRKYIILYYTDQDPVQFQVQVLLLKIRNVRLILLYEGFVISAFALQQ